MNTKAFTHPGRCPEVLNQQALQLSFQVLRTAYPALALHIRNAITSSSDSQPLAASALSTACVHNIVAALSHRSKSEGLSGRTDDLVTVRKLLLIWMEYERQRQQG
jgi:hypothetical protein